jgi:DNA-binding MarR family transcriptional regulator
MSRRDDTGNTPGRFRDEIVDKEIIYIYGIGMVDSTPERRPLTGFLLWQLSLKWRAAVDRALAPLGLTHAQYALLGSLYRLARSGTRPSQRELADFSGLEPMYVSKLARALENAGLLARTPNAADPRAFHLTVTDRGRDAFDAAYVRVAELHERLLAPLDGPGDPRRAEFRETLETLLRHADGLDGSTPVDRVFTEK